MSEHEPNFSHQETETGGSIFLERDGERVAKIDYRRAPSGAMEVHHTFVDTSMRGQGMARKLVAAAVEHARRTDCKISPSCSAARAILQKTPDYHDVLEAAYLP
ncbi:N-acetyltransferase [Lujinxingia vulgaris]|uniref:N-acetyltransferase n=1 Tax=Lujinxingia vulgaris TaxID=2600176 RepID=A0A5C6XK37_9DELT|nr:GNAT family N-acetyltransferase [Lujinxingia vulgaris]TXD39310.1 N-acetyltransferase [Lujinxingia vulgaris]